MNEQEPDSVPPSRTSSELTVNRDPKLFINRELSWLEFNSRVLANASDERIPLYERLKFLAIFSSNLDEFFMVRVAGLQAQQLSEIDDAPPDGRTPAEQLVSISRRAHELGIESYKVWNDQLRGQLRTQGVALVKPEELSPEDRAALDRHFDKDIFPVLTPIALDPAHPFPHVRNKAINVGVIFDKRDAGQDPAMGVVQLPTALPRLIRVPLDGTRRAFVAMEDLILRRLGDIFPQQRIKGGYSFRVVRNFDIEIDEDEGEDLLLALQAELRKRERGNAVRLDVGAEAPESVLHWLCRCLDLRPELDVYRSQGPLNLAQMTELVSGDERRDLRDESFGPQYVPPFRDSDDFFETIAEGDVLLHHPYESFEAVVDFLAQAAEDPAVLAIKMTLYRTGGESPLVRSLQRAAELGKQVTALVELKARFDEQSNIEWARALERSGVNVMYGFLGLKTHAKVMLVVRKERSGLKRYVHLATGNYNQQTAKLYEDLSIFTAREDIAEDATALFNLLTGYSAPPRWNKLVAAPLGLHERVLGLIHRETEHALAGREAAIVAKMNSLVDADVVAALYQASQAGVKIELIVRGICCLRPGVPGVSENIRVVALIDRFLEHARIFHFKNGGEDEVYCSSADWMPRNFRRRVEILFPVLDAALARRIVDEILALMRRDNVSNWRLQGDGTYVKVERGASEEPVRSQHRFMELARERARDESTPSLRDGAQATLAKLRRKKRSKGRRERED